MDYQKAILDKVSTGSLIGSYIAKSGLTFEQLADLLQLNTPRVIYEWLHGKKLPNIENLYNLALVFNARMEDLLIFE